MVAAYYRWVNLGVVLGPFRLNHWLTWMGTLYVAFAVPTFVISKRRYPVKIGRSLGFMYLATYWPFCSYRLILHTR